MKLTRTQRAILQAIADLEAPTYREIQEACGFPSVSTVSYTANVLSSRGLLDLPHDGRARQLRLTRLGKTVLKEAATA